MRTLTAEEFIRHTKERNLIEIGGGFKLLRCGKREGVTTVAILDENNTFCNLVADDVCIGTDYDKQK